MPWFGERTGAHRRVHESTLGLFPVLELEVHMALGVFWLVGNTLVGSKLNSVNYFNKETLPQTHEPKKSAFQ